MDHLLQCSGYDHAGINVVHARGASLFSAAGKRYVDFESGVWSASLGHNHPAVASAVRRQTERVIHLGYRVESALAEDAAVEILGTLPCSDGKCIFLVSGSEAVEFAVQTARQLTRRRLSLSLFDSYLSAFGASAQRDTEEWHRFDWAPCASCSKDIDCDPQCRLLASVPFDRIGAFVFEPGTAGGRVGLPPGGVIRRLAERTKIGGGLLIVDEVTTGLGRTGAWYGFDHYRLTPDIVALGKGLGNGYPVSAVAMSRNVAMELENEGLRYAQSHQNDPLGSVVAKTVIETLRAENLIDRSQRIGRTFLAGLEGLGERHRGIHEVRGRGLLLATEFSAGQVPSAEDVFRRLLDRGFLVGCKPAWNLLRFLPPLTIEEEEIARLLSALDEVLQEAA